MNISFNQKQLDFILNTLKSKYPEYADDLFEELKEAKDLTELTEIAKEFAKRQMQVNSNNNEV